MMRPDDIPEDIWNDARKTWEAARLLTDKHGASVPETYTLLISRAIMAATERAAQIAENHNEWPQEGADIAAAIRQGSQPPKPSNDDFRRVPHNGEIA